MKVISSRIHHPPNFDYKWLCSLEDGLAYVAFDTARGYSVCAGSVMAGEIDERWSQIKREAVATGSLQPASKGCWRLTENISVNSPVDAASIFLGKNSENARWIDLCGKSIPIAELPATARWPARPC